MTKPEQIRDIALLIDETLHEMICERVPMTRPKRNAEDQRQEMCRAVLDVLNDFYNQRQGTK